MVEEKRLPLGEHLEELRVRIISSLAAIVIIAAIVYIFRGKVLNFLINFSEENSLIYIHPTEAFLTYLRLAVLSGLVLSTPWILYQVWRFILPALLEKEEKYLRLSFFIGGLLFYIGVGISIYFILPFSLNLLGEVGNEDLLMRLSVRNYISFVTLLAFSTGLVFEQPLFTFLLVELDFVSLNTLKKYRSYAILISFTVAAFLTPTDWFSQILMAVPLVILYELSILLITIKQKIIPSKQ